MFLILVLLEDELSFWSLRRHVGILGFGYSRIIGLVEENFLSSVKIGEKIL